MSLSFRPFPSGRLNEVVANQGFGLEGVHCTYLIAGRLEMCAEGVWRAVCTNRWGQPDADTVCRQIGFNPPGEC